MPETPPSSPPLAVRREALLARSAELRQTVAADLVGVTPVLDAADRVRAGWEWAKANPLWVGAGVAVLAAWRPRRAVALGLRAWSVWQTVQRVREFVKK